MDRGAWWAAVYGVAKSRTRLSDFTLTFHFAALEKEMATHSSILAWRIPGTGEPRGLTSMGSHRVGHDWSDLAAAATVHLSIWRLISSSSGLFFFFNLRPVRGVSKPCSTAFSLLSLESLLDKRSCSLFHDALSTSSSDLSALTIAMLETGQQRGPGARTSRGDQHQDLHLTPSLFTLFLSWVWCPHVWVLSENKAPSLTRRGEAVGGLLGCCQNERDQVGGFRWVTLQSLLAF